MMRLAVVSRCGDTQVHDCWLVTILGAVRSTGVVVQRFKFMTPSYLCTRYVQCPRFRPGLASTREMEFPKTSSQIVLSIPLHTGPKWTFRIHSLSKFLIAKAISVKGRSILRGEFHKIFYPFFSFFSFL